MASGWSWAHLFIMDAFRIRIVEQGWIPGGHPESDRCSHGRLHLVIGGVTIEDGRDDFGISETALHLLRTLDADHVVNDDRRDPLVVHGCGTMLMINCGVGIDWTLRHDRDDVVLEDVRRYPWPGGEARQVSASARLPLATYSSSVLTFATEARSLFERLPEKWVSDRSDRAMFERFWAEFDERLRRRGVTTGPTPAARLRPTLVVRRLALRLAALVTLR